jgi:hypothetical protein
MRAYMQALLEVAGMMAGQPFNLEKMLGNFATHLKAGRFRPVSGGRVVLTSEGRDYFASRLTDQPMGRGQYVDRVEVLAMIRNVVAEPAPPGWEPVEVELA